MGELSRLPNIGPVVESQLNTVGIHTYEQLKAEGSRQAWLKIKAIDDSACITGSILWKAQYRVSKIPIAARDKD